MKILYKIFDYPKVFLLCLGVAIFIPGLGQELTLGSHEARHALMSYTIARTGEYAVPYLYGEPYIDKPPLFNCVVAVLFKISGAKNLAVARLPSAFFAVVAMLAIYSLGKRWLTLRAGLFAAMIWATSWMVVRWGRMCRMDMMLAVIILYAVLLADLSASFHDRRKSGFTWILACLVVGLGILAKGPIALFYYFACVVAIWRARRSEWLPSGFLLAAGLLVAGLPFALWAIVAEYVHPGHMREFFGYQFGLGLVEHHKSFVTYFYELILRTLPWSLFSVGAILWTVRRLKSNGYGLAVVPAVVTLVEVGVMTFVPNKRPHYLLPSLPMWSILLGGFIDWSAAFRDHVADKIDPIIEEEMPPWAFERTLLFILGFATVVSAVSIPFWLAYSHSGRLIGAAVALATSMIAGTGFRAVRREEIAVGVWLLFATVLVLTISAYPVFFLGSMEPTTEIRGVKSISVSLADDRPIADFGVRDPYLCFGSANEVTFISDAEKLRKFVDEVGRCYVVASKDDPRIPSELGNNEVKFLGTWQVLKGEVRVMEVSSRKQRLGESEQTG